MKTLEKNKLSELPELSGFLSIPENIKEFVQKYVNSFVKWDILEIFAQNPLNSFSLDYIAFVTSRDLITTEKNLKELTEVKLLEESQHKNIDYYFLTSNNDLRFILKAFFNYLQLKENRLKIITLILRMSTKGGF